MNLKEELSLQKDLENIDFVKGVYKNNFENRKKGRVGQKYGGKKEEEEDQSNRKRKIVATFEGRDIEGNLEFSDEDSFNEKMISEIDNIYNKKKQEIREKLEKEIGIEEVSSNDAFDSFFNSLGIKNYKNAKEISKKVKEKMKEEGYSKSLSYKEGNLKPEKIVSTPKLQYKISHGKDVGGQSHSESHIQVEISK